MLSTNTIPGADGGPVPDCDSSTPFVEQLVRSTLDLGGCTADLTTRRILPAEDVWYFPRFPDSTMIVSQAELASSVRRFIALHRKLLLTGDLWLGTWINPATQACYLDLITRHSDQHEARRLARLYSRRGKRKIIAICNPGRRQTRPVWDEPIG